MGEITFGMAGTRFLVVAAASLYLASAIPTLTSTTYFNLGNAIRVKYNATDGFDGRNSGNKAISGTGTDWIGLFRKDTCNSPKNLVDRHKCYLATRSVPRTQMWGEVIFEVNDYKEAGDYDVRYFYGDDPLIEGASTSPHFTWAGNGYVCNTAAGMEGSIFYLNQIDPDWVAYVNSRQRWNTSHDSHPYQPTADCSCDPTTGDFATRRACCLRHQNCQPQMDSAIQVCRHYHDTYMEDQNVVVSCACSANTDQCKETKAACLRCALDTVATSTVHVLDSFGMGDTQMSAKEIPGFELALETNVWRLCWQAQNKHILVRVRRYEYY